MSKIDDLMAAFKTGFRDRLQGPGIRPEGDIAIRAGIRAVVTALRDEFENEMGKCLDCSASGVHDHIDEVFDEILGDAGERVTDIGGAFGGLMDGLAKACSPAAPETCEWTQQSLQAFYDSECGLDSMTHGNAVVKCQGYCPSCGKPIKFKEKS